MDGVSSSGDTADVLKPPRITLRPIDLCLATERLVDCWHALRRSSVDAAVLPLSENNVFAFADMCLFMATVHDLEAVENKSKNLKKIHNVNVPPIPQEDRPSFLFGNDTIRSSANIGATCDQPSWSEQESQLMNGQQESSPSSASAHTVPPDYNAVAPIHQGNVPASPPMANALDNTSYNAYDQAEFDMAGFTLPDDPSIISNSEPVSSDLVGIAYLCPAMGTAASACEVSMGVAILPRARGRGFGTETVRHLLRLAFEEFKFHRVSAGVIGPRVGRPSACGTSVSPGTIIETEAALRMFVGIGFSIEGTQYRALPDSEDNGAWRDVHYLAMLDTCWFGTPLGHPLGSGGLDNNRARAYSSLQNRRTRWDEMLARHQKEREMLISAESCLKRSASTETLRPDVGTSAKGADVGVSLASSSISTSSAASECATSNSVEHDRLQDDQSPALSSSNSFSNPPTFARSEFQPRSRPQSASGDENIHEDDLMIDFDASAVHAKVARFLLAHPAPGPPPTELGSNLDSEADSVSEFESCADPDELDLLGGVKDKGKAKETMQQKQDQKEIQALSSIEGDPFANSDLSEISYDTPAVMVADEHFSPLVLSGQARKKRRLLSDLVGEAKNTSSPNLLGAAAPHLGTSTLSRPCKTSPLFNFSPNSSRLTSEFAGKAIPTTTVPFPDEDPSAYSDAHSEEESVLSEVETISTGMSAWDVVSSASDPHHSPSPTYSLSSGTSSLSLQNVSGNPDDRD